MKKILLSILLAFSFATNAQTWIEQATGFTNPNRTLNSISIVDADTVWATAIDNTDPLHPVYTIKEFTQTLNGGILWKPGTIDLGVITPADLSISSISAIDASTAWVSVYPDGNLSEFGGIWKTTTSGATWTKETTTQFTNANSYANFVHFWDANHGVTVGDPVNGAFEIYTFNGTSWSDATLIPTPLTDGNGEFGIFNRYSVSGNTIWFGTDRGRIYKSDDYGVTWTVNQSSSTDFTQDRFSFSDTNNGVLTIYSSPILLSTTGDGGVHWSVPAAGPLNTDIVCIPNSSKIVACDWAKPFGSSYSLHGGTDWTLIDPTNDTGVQHGTLTFLNENIGFSAGINTSNTVGGIYKFSGFPALKTASFDMNNQIAVYPNPTNGLLHVNSKASLVKEATVYDLLGKKVYSSKISASNNISLDLKSLQSGIYTLKVTSDTGKTENIKIIKN